MKMNKKVENFLRTVTTVGKTTFHYGFIPGVIYLGKLAELISSNSLMMLQKAKHP